MTTIKLAIKPADYRKCHALMKAMDSEFAGCRLHFPTVMAFRDNKLVGFLSTAPRTDGLIAEPLVMNVEGNPSFLFLKLVDAYDSLLAAGGVPSYFFLVPHGYGEYRKLVEKAGFEPLGDNEVGVWYRRTLHPDMLQNIGEKAVSQTFEQDEAAV